MDTITVSIVAKGTSLPEYDPHDAKENEVDGQTIRYIEGVEGTVFSLKIALSRATRWRTGYKAAYLYIDGKYVDAWRISQEKTGGRHQGWQIDLHDVRVLEGGSWFKRPFMFKHLQTTDETRKLEDLKKIAQGLGCITVELFDVTRGEIVATDGYSVAESGAVPEKALKGQPINVSAGFGPKTPSSQGREAISSKTAAGR